MKRVRILCSSNARMFRGKRRIEFPRRVIGFDEIGCCYSFLNRQTDMDKLMLSNCE